MLNRIYCCAFRLKSINFIMGKALHIRDMIASVDKTLDLIIGMMAVMCVLSVYVALQLLDAHLANSTIRRTATMMAPLTTH